MIADSFLLDESTGVNGTQVQMYNLAKAFSQKGIEVHYITLTNKNPTDNETVDGIKLHWISGVRRLYSWLVDLIVYRKILDSIQPDIVYQRGRSHLTWLGAKWANKHSKIFVWGSNGEDACDFWKFKGRLNRSERPVWRKALLLPLVFMQDLLVHRGVRKASIVVNQTEYQQKQLYKNYSKTGVVLPSYFVAPPSNYESEKQKIVVWLANLSRGKQPEKFIELAEACQDQRDWLFLLGGGTTDIEYENSLNKRTANLLNFKMIGTVPFTETGEIYNKASLFVNTSEAFADGIPNAFIQAMLHGTPILSLNHDPNGWIEQHDLGYCAHGDIQDFFRQGKALLDDDDKLSRLGERCALFAKSTFSSEATIDKYLQLFD